MNKVEQDKKLYFDDVNIKPQISSLTSRKDVNLNTVYKFKYSSKVFSGIPIVAANLDTTGTFEMDDVLHSMNLVTCLHKFYPVDELIKNSYKFTDKLWYSMGISENDLEKYNKFKSNITVQPEVVCIDIANGYQERLLKFVSEFRLHNSNTILVVGNVCTPEITEMLILAGADVCKIGLGSGGMCRTTEVTGVGYPQLSAILECSDAAARLGGHICSDGGCKTPGDVAKAFSAGSAFVMLGSMLAGVDECKGVSIEKEGFRYLQAHGMSSDAAMLEHYGRKESYRASEGKEELVKYKGPVKNVVNEILGGLRSCCTYSGASSIKELQKKATFIRV